MDTGGFNRRPSFSGGFYDGQKSLKRLFDAITFAYMRLQNHSVLAYFHAACRAYRTAYRKCSFCMARYFCLHAERRGCVVRLVLRFLPSDKPVFGYACLPSSYASRNAGWPSMAPGASTPPANTHPASLACSKHSSQPSNPLTARASTPAASSAAAESR